MAAVGAGAAFIGMNKLAAQADAQMAQDAKDMSAAAAPPTASKADSGSDDAPSTRRTRIKRS